AHGGTLLDHAHREFRGELLEPDRERQARWARTDGDDVVLHDVALDVDRLALARLLHCRFLCHGPIFGFRAAAGKSPARAGILGQAPCLALEPDAPARILPFHRTPAPD